MKHTWRRIQSSAMIMASLTALAGCTHHTIEVQPIRVEPIHMIVDVNVKVDRELDRFFDFEDQVNAPATQPTTVPQPAPATASEGTAP